jgi:hypothetical protein
MVHGIFRVALPPAIIGVENIPGMNLDASLMTGSQDLFQGILG